jgi:iron-sulfur cluster assembly protein
MLAVSERANEMISSFLAGQKDPSYIRLYLSQGCCSGPSLGMALDEPKEDDEIIKDNGVTYLIEKDLYEKVRPINIDYVESDMGSGYSITSAMSHGSSCGSCSC